MASPVTRETQQTAAVEPSQPHRRRPPAWPEEQRRKAWTKWWNSISPEQRKK